MVWGKEKQGAFVLNLVSVPAFFLASNLFLSGGKKGRKAAATSTIPRSGEKNMMDYDTTGSSCTVSEVN